MVKRTQEGGPPLIKKTESSTGPVGSIKRTPKGGRANDWSPMGPKGGQQLIKKT